mmetsp:Transcript_55744/g.130047  ORF Transcript_55744/g.130047 Transcript_55744/m.130047 type:complete len:232 (-) Transcript_55744:503-1198(-)
MSACAPNKLIPPPRKRPDCISIPGSVPSAKSPTARTPQIPEPPCTPTAPTGSSSLSWRIAAFTDNATREPTKPMIKASCGCTQAHGAVMATKDPKMPLATWSGRTIPLVAIFVYSSAPTPPPAVALIVVTATLVATAHFWFVIPKVLPQLKPIQPHHNMKRPKRILAGEDGRKSFAGRVPSKRPILGPSHRIPQSPFIAPRRCTGPLPAKSCAPSTAIQPFSAQTQWATKE